jgi:acyl CoA:acetate/3-ketoacid CoA transferase beta subunit
VANFLPADREIFLHSESGLLGMAPAPAKGEEDPELIHAGRDPVTLLPSGCCFHHGDSFAMMRGGYLDICVLGDLAVIEVTPDGLVVTEMVEGLPPEKLQCLAAVPLTFAVAQ